MVEDSNETRNIQVRVNCAEGLQRGCEILDDWAIFCLTLGH